MHRLIAGAVCVAILIGSAFTVSATATSTLDTAQIDKLTGIVGTLDEEEGVYKVSAPRSDLHVVSKAVCITPPMGLTSWAAFKRVGKQAMVMGDIVLEQDQVNPVMSVASGWASASAWRSRTIWARTRRSIGPSNFLLDVFGVRHREGHEDIRFRSPMARDQIREQAHAPAGPICLGSGRLGRVLDEAENSLGVAHELLSGVGQLEALARHPEELDTWVREGLAVVREGLES